MKKSKAVTTTVILVDDDDEHRLEVNCEDDVLEFRIDGKVVFKGDWTANFRELFMEAINYFPQLKMEA